MWNLLWQRLVVATNVAENCLELILRNIGDVVLSEAVVGGCMGSRGRRIEVGGNCRVREPGLFCQSMGVFGQSVAGINFLVLAVFVGLLVVVDGRDADVVVYGDLLVQLGVHPLLRRGRPYNL